MMEYKATLNNFKENLEGEKAFSFSFFEPLFLLLKQNGATQSIVTKEFIEDLNALFFPGQPTSLLFLSLEYVKYYSKIILPKEQVKSDKKTGSASILPAINHKEKQEQHNKNLDETDLDDGLLTPPDQVIAIDKSKLPDKQLDWEFLNELGAIGMQDE